MAGIKPEGDIELIYLTFSEVQEFLSVCRQTVYKIMKEGLPSHKIGKKRVFLKGDLFKWLKGFSKISSSLWSQLKNVRSAR